MQRNVDITDQLWEQLQILAKGLYTSRAKLTRDCVYTMIKKATEGQPLKLYHAPYRTKGSTTLLLAPHQAYVQTDDGLQLTTIDPETGLIALGDIYGEYVAGFPRPPQPTRTAREIKEAANPRPKDPRIVDGMVAGEPLTIAERKARDAAVSNVAQYVKGIKE